MILNAVLFNNEYELLKFRLRHYEGLIDRFILLTSDTTFSGAQKIDFDPNFDSIGKNLEIVKLDKKSLQDKDFTERWPVELESRNQLLDYAASKYPKAVIIHTDADEFPSKNQITEILLNEGLSYGTIPLKTYYRRGNWASSGINENWMAVSCFRSVNWLSGELKETRGRYVGGETIHGEKGSHFSYLDMGPNEVNSKLASFSHSELDVGPEVLELILPLADEYVVDHLGRARDRSFGLLKVEKLVALDSVQLAALEFRAEWFDFESPKRMLLSRIAVSIFITNQIHCLKLFMKFPTSHRQEIRIVAEFFWFRVLKKIDKVVKSVLKIGHR